MQVRGLAPTACALLSVAVATVAMSAPTQAAATDTAGTQPPLAEVGPLADLGTLGTDVDGAAIDVPDALAATDTLRPDQDTFISSAQPGTNFGSSSTLNVGDRAGYGATRTAVQFRVSDLARDRAVTEAHLRLYLRQAGPANDPGRDIPILRITDPWSESGLTWNECNDCVDGRRWDTVNMGPNPGWYEWTSTELVQRWRWPSWQKDRYYPNYGFGVQGYETAGSFRAFDSREGSNRPELAIEHVQDTTPPTSRVLPKPLYLNTPDAGKDYATIRLEWDGTDPDPATGIDYFWVLVKINNGGYSGMTSSSNNPPDAWRRYDTDFRGYNGKVYNFVSYATDMAGNREPNKVNPDTVVHVDWSAPETTVSPLPAYTQAQNIELSWTGQDLPTGADIQPSGIAGYEVWFNFNNTSWGLAETLPPERNSTVYVDAIDNASYQFRIVGVDRAGNKVQEGPAQATTFVDRTAPEAWVDPIDKPLAQTTFTVSWAGTDNPPGATGSGIASYDVQVRTGTGAWQAWQTGTTAQSQPYTGRLGNVYSFRARATDKAGNVGAWSAEQAATVVDPEHVDLQAAAANHL